MSVHACTFAAECGLACVSVLSYSDGLQKRLELRSDVALMLGESVVQTILSIPQLLHACMQVCDAAGHPRQLFRPREVPDAKL